MRRGKAGSGWVGKADGRLVFVLFVKQLCSCLVLFITCVPETQLAFFSRNRIAEQDLNLGAAFLSHARIHIFVRIPPSLIMGAGGLTPSRLCLSGST